jgi:hypothetical protein
MTFPALYGLEKSRTLAAQWTSEAIQCLKAFGPRGATLRGLASAMLSREN